MHLLLLLVFRIVAKCHRSYRMNRPVTITAVSLLRQVQHNSCVCLKLFETHHAACSCATGSSGCSCCGHIIGLQYHLSDYKVRDLRAIPDPVPSIHHYLKSGISIGENRCNKGGGIQYYCRSPWLDLQNRVLFAQTVIIRLLD